MYNKPRSSYSYQYHNYKSNLNVSQVKLRIMANPVLGEWHYAAILVRILCFDHSFTTGTINLWNSLPPSIVDCQTLDHFKHMLSLHKHM